MKSFTQFLSMFTFSPKIFNHHMKNSLILFVIFIISFACKKANEISPIGSGSGGAGSSSYPAPSASFTIKDGYLGIFTFNVNSSDVDSYSWNFGDGQSSSIISPQHLFIYNGTFLVKLTVTGKGGVKVITQNLRVTDVRGEATFWMSSGNNTVDVKVDGIAIGAISSNYSSRPSCAASGTASKSLLTEGVHSFSAKENRLLLPRSWSGSINVIGGQCTTQQLTL